LPRPRNILDDNSFSCVKIEDSCGPAPAGRDLHFDPSSAVACPSSVADYCGGRATEDRQACRETGDPLRRSGTELSEASAKKLGTRPKGGESGRSPDNPPNVRKLITVIRPPVKSLRAREAHLTGRAVRFQCLRRDSQENRIIKNYYESQHLVAVLNHSTDRWSLICLPGIPVFIKK
jgi:hypothetical protein